ncbi:uncharacterized protein LOC134281305 [Saccostrea cucullata]|uniref:uncharacterized protein LOC134281305 n=1 Tax=Saccostrea cuccullata TaxID=36930 RepID=UPI002ED65BC8
MDLKGSSTQSKVRQCFQCQGDTEFYCNTCKYDLCLQCKERHVTNTHKVVFYRTKYSKRGYAIQCNVRQCSECKGNTEFYCNTCKHDLCLQCKEKHVIDLDTVYHDLVIYREKYKKSLKRETCVRHPDMIFEKYCYSSELPFCAKCGEHRNPKFLPSFLEWKKQRKRKILDIRIAYERKRRQHKGIIKNIRIDTLYNCCFLLSRINTDLKNRHTEISNFQSEMSAKAHRLKGLIDTVICDVKIRLLSLMIQQQIKQMNSHLASIEKYEHSYEESANRPVKFLFIIKNIEVPILKDTPNLTQLVRYSLKEDSNLEDVPELLSEIIETGKRQVRDECVLKLMSKPMLHKIITVTGVFGVNHISYVSSDRMWVSDVSNLTLTNTEGDELHNLTDIRSGWGVHTVDIAGDLIYIDKHCKINKLSSDNKSKSTLVMNTYLWKPLSVFCSPSNGDVLVGMSDYRNTGKINRYNSGGYHIQTIKKNNTGQELYRYPLFITENHNGDIIVSDEFAHEEVILERGEIIKSETGRLVVTDGRGKHRFSYEGYPSGSKLGPLGICTDALSHTLLCDSKTHTVQMIDKDGHFLSLILTWLVSPYSLSYDNKTHLLWVGSFNNKVCAYRYITRQDSLTAFDDVIFLRVICTDILYK